MAKAIISGYRRADGTVVRSYHRRDRPKKHPEFDDNGNRVVIEHPSTPSAIASWVDPDATAVFVPGGNVPAEINGIPLVPWEDAPETAGGWSFVDGVNDKVTDEPIITPPGMRQSSGVVIREKDGRVWLVAPTNAFGGYKNTFPKGGIDEGLTPQQTAIKECFEESGLQVRITGLVGEFARTTSVTRFYFAERVGGDPSACGWETQAVSLVPKGDLYKYLNMYTDREVAEAIGAGPEKL